MTSSGRSAVVETPANFTIVSKIDGFEQVFHGTALRSFNYVFVGSFAYEPTKITGSNGVTQYDVWQMKGFANANFWSFR